MSTIAKIGGQQPRIVVDQRLLILSFCHRKCACTVPRLVYLCLLCRGGWVDEWMDVEMLKIEFGMKLRHIKTCIVYIYTYLCKC